MFKFYELLSSISAERVPGNCWQFAEAWYLYIKRWLEVYAGLTIED